MVKDRTTIFRQRIEDGMELADNAQELDITFNETHALRAACTDGSSELMTVLNAFYAGISTALSPPDKFRSTEPQAGTETS